MPSFVYTEKCDGCKGQDKTACMYICPHDLMMLDKARMKAYNQEPEQCWECYSCVKICPQQAIGVRAYADIVPMGGEVIPLPRVRLHHVDRQVPQRPGRAVQVPHADHGRGIRRSYKGKPGAEARRPDEARLPSRTRARRSPPSRSRREGGISWQKRERLETPRSSRSRPTF